MSIRRANQRLGATRTYRAPALWPALEYQTGDILLIPIKGKERVFGRSHKVIYRHGSVGAIVDDLPHVGLNLEFLLQS